ATESHGNSPSLAHNDHLRAVLAPILRSDRGLTTNVHSGPFRVLRWMRSLFIYRVDGDSQGGTLWRHRKSPRQIGENHRRKRTCWNGSSDWARGTRRLAPRRWPG